MFKPINVLDDLRNKYVGKYVSFLRPASLGLEKDLEASGGYLIIDSIDNSMIGLRRIDRQPFIFIETNYPNGTYVNKKIYGLSFVHLFAESIKIFEKIETPIIKSRLDLVG